MTTERNQSLHELTLAQERAAVIVGQGGTHKDAAAAAGVNRVTVTNWANHHPAFIAEVNRARAESLTHVRGVIEETTNAAIAVVFQAITAGDLDCAFRWLKIHPPSRLMEQVMGPMHSIDVVEEVRRTLPTDLERAIFRSDEPTSSEAEVAIEAALEVRSDGKTDERERG